MSGNSTPLVASKKSPYISSYCAYIARVPKNTLLRETSILPGFQVVGEAQHDFCINCLTLRNIDTYNLHSIGVPKVLTH